MKKIVKLTKSDLHNIIKSAIKKTLNESYGTNYYVGTCNKLLDMFLDELSDNYTDDDLMDDFVNYCRDNDDLFVINADIDGEWDDNSWKGTVYSISEIDQYDIQCLHDLIDNYQNGNARFKQEMKDCLDNVIDNLDVDDFELAEYENDN